MPSKKVLSTPKLILAVLAGCGLAVWIYLIWDPRPGDEEPVLVPPSVSYVGYQKCAECHSDVFEKHQHSGHFSTFHATKTSDIAMQLCGRTLETDDASELTVFACDDEGLTVEMPNRFPGRLFPLDWSIGSGKHAVTFLTLLQDSQNEVVGIEHSNTWYTADERIGPTPGHEDFVPSTVVEQFGKVFQGENLERCIFCHVTTGEISGTSIKNLRPGVNCEKCHGPGEEHVAAMESGVTPESLLIRKSWTASEEIAMCGKCHRTAESIEPDRLTAYPPSLTRFQPVGLVRSECFLKSPQSLSCSTCHDPHSPVEATTRAEQIQNCLQCHQDASQVHCPVSQTGDCIQCHMPKHELVDGIFFHDHWIRIIDQNSLPDHKSSN